MPAKPKKTTPKIKKPELSVLIFLIVSVLGIGYLFYGIFFEPTWVAYTTPKKIPTPTPDYRIDDSVPNYIPPSATVTLHPSIIPTEIPTPTIVPDPIDPNTGWRIRNTSAGYSFQYPPTWRSVQDPGSSGARIVPVNNPYQYSRAFIFLVQENPHGHALTSAEITSGESFAPDSGYQVKAIPTEPFTVGSIEGVRLLNPYAGTLEVIYISYGDDVIQIMLSGGGAHGGYDSENLPTAAEDRELFFKVLKTFKP